MLAERERHLDCDDDGNRLPVSDSRREAPLLRRAARRLIEAILAIERSNHVDFANGAIGLGPFTRAETPPSRYFRLQTSNFRLQIADFCVYVPTLNGTDAIVLSHMIASVPPVSVTSRNSHDSSSCECGSVSTFIGARTTSLSGV